MRLRSNGSDNWWLRFHVTHDTDPWTARVVSELPPLGLVPASAAIDVDVQACKLALWASTKKVGDLALTLELDPSQRVRGRLTLSRAAVAAERDQVVEGVRDQAPPAGACIQPGVYQLALAPAAWSNVNPRDRKPCERVSQRASPVWLRVDAAGDELAISVVDFGAHHRQRPAFVALERLGPCERRLTLYTEARALEGRFDLTFSPGEITGSADAEVHLVEPEDDHDEILNCKAQGVGVTAKRLPPARTAN